MSYTCKRRIQRISVIVNIKEKLWIMQNMLQNQSQRSLLETVVNMMTTQTNGNDTDDSAYNVVSKANFDTNMVIILAALLCALLGALGVNSILRCAMRCSRTFTRETPQQAAARLAARGLKKKDLRQIPVAVYGDGVDVRHKGGISECPICLGEFEDGDKVRVLPKCNHEFHVRCIDTWLSSHSSCPNCRHSLLDPSSPTPSNVNQEIGAVQSSGNGSSQHAASVVIVID